MQKLVSELRGVLALAICTQILCSVLACLAQSPVPRIFYTDLLSGPATGGESGEGAFVTLYGTGFGKQQASSNVSIGGIAAFAYPIWSDTRITLQIAKNARSGPIVAHVASRPDSNAQPFTIRPGHISFVSPLGNDKNKGSFAAPLRTLLAAKAALHPGDIVYAMNGVDQSSRDQYESAFSIQSSGEEGAPIAVVAYPGAKVTIGSFSGPRIAARTPNIARRSDHWVLAGLTFRGAQQALDVTDSTDWRIIGNDFSCPRGFGPTGCIETGQSSHLAFLGNTVHDIAQPGTTKVYHALYFSTDSNHIEVGWNTIANVRSCRGLQFHSSPLGPGTGMNQYDLHVHDNIIHDVVCDGINFATVDPSKGPVEAYNNLIYHVGTGPDPEDGSANYACIYVQGGANAGPPGSGTVELYNNTLYNCGARGNIDSGAFSLSQGSPDQYVRLRNDIVVLLPGQHVLSASSTTAPLIGEADILWTPAGALLPARLSSKQWIARDPLLVDPAHGDFSLRPGSPAIAAGIPVDLAWDVQGSPRAARERPDIGAMQHVPIPPP
jgi:Right handed beta helix region